METDNGINLQDVAFSRGQYLLYWEYGRYLYLY